MKNRPTVGIVAIALGVLTTLIPILLFPVCTDMFELTSGKTLFMKCHWTAMSELVLGILVVLDGIFIIVFKKHETRLVLSIMLFLFGLAVLLLTTVVIGMCQTATMQCRVGTEPALIVVSILTMLTGIANIFIQRSLLKKEAR